MINELNILLIHFFLALLIFGAVLIFKFTEMNRSQKVLFCILLSWTYYFTRYSIKIIIGTPVLESVLNFSTISAAFIGYLSFIAYPIVATNYEFFTIKRTFLFISPVIAVLLLYFGVHLFLDLPMNKIYASLNDVWADRYSPTVLLRVLICAVFCGHAFLTVRSLRKLIHRLHYYSQQNYSEIQYSASWIRKILLFVAGVFVVYIVHILFNTNLSLTLYLSVAIILFAMIIINALFYGSFRTDVLDISFSLRKGWVVTERLVDAHTRTHAPLCTPARGGGGGYRASYSVG